MQAIGPNESVISRLDRRRPSRYTASYSARCTKRQVRGNASFGRSDAREAVASLFAALRKDFSSTLALHACAEPVLLVTARAHAAETYVLATIFSSILPCCIAAAPARLAPAISSLLNAKPSRPVIPRPLPRQSHSLSRWSRPKARVPASLRASEASRNNCESRT